jgi:hypothetical protein
VLARQVSRLGGQARASQQKAATGRVGWKLASDGPSSNKIRSPSCALTAAMGNNRANSISENEPNCEYK